jgi:hypothetical protein
MYIAVRQESDMQTVMELSGGLGIKDLFEVGKTSRMEGSSGPFLLSKKSGFGYVAKGIGQRQGEALIVLRGTVTARDWWTDANIGLQSGPEGSWFTPGSTIPINLFTKIYPVA